MCKALVRYANFYTNTNEQYTSRIGKNGKLKKTNANPCDVLPNPNALLYIMYLISDHFATLSKPPKKAGQSIIRVYKFIESQGI